jgi:putative inorganic carbon (hco3(-)) transporter
MNFVLFLLLNATLMLRPEEFFSDIAGLRLYLISVALCIGLSLPKLLQILSPESLKNRPIAVCVLLFFLSTIVSLCVVGQIDEALFYFGPDFAKVILYYFLLLAVVDTPSRFRTFVAALVVLIAILTAVALAQNFGIVNFPNIIPCVQNDVIDPVTGEKTSIPRLVSSGIFNDPNDLCLVLGLGIFSCLYGATTTPSWLWRTSWLWPIPIFIYALIETHSRGGLLGVMAGVAGYLFSRYGGAKSIPIAIAGGVVALLIIGGRQAEITGGGTAHERLMLWAQGIVELFQKPLYIPTGLGIGWYVGEYGLVAHNSFIQAYVELGLLGGGAFLGAFYIAARILLQFGRGIDAPEWALQARHYAFAVVAGYGVGCYSLTRNFVVPTYLTLGLASVLIGTVPQLPEKYRVNGIWFVWAILFSICGLGLIRFATQILTNAGV